MSLSSQSWWEVWSEHTNSIITANMPEEGGEVGGREEVGRKGRGKKRGEGEGNEREGTLTTT